MPWRPLPLGVYPALLAALLAAYSLGRQADEARVVRPVDGQLLFGQSSGDDDEGEEEEAEEEEKLPASRRITPGSFQRPLQGPRGFPQRPSRLNQPAPERAEPAGEGPARLSQRLGSAGGQRSAEYAFKNFNQDRVEIGYRIGEDEFARYNAAFGYRQEDIDELRQWRENAKQSAYKLAVKSGKSQSQLDAAVAGIEREYQRKLQEYMSSRGFKLENNVTRVDMPQLVRRNGPQIKPLALTFERFAQARRYRSGDIVGAVLSFVQTALQYRQPDTVYKGKHTGGVLPPITAVILGWGDCDTKSGLLASILSNWTQMRMVGISVPGHYLMAVLQIPDKGDLFVEHQGLKYVLLEPAGPAWLPPGRVAEETLAQLNAREGYKIEPFF